MKILHTEDILKYIAKSTSKVYLWGCSTATQKLLKLIDKKIDGVIDNYYIKDRFCSYKVFKPEYLLNLSDCILIVSGNHCNSIFNQLRFMKLNKMVTILFDYDNGGKNILSKKLYVTTDDIDIYKNEVSSLNITTLEHYQASKVKSDILIKIDYLEKIYTTKEIDNLILNYLNDYININKIYIGCGEDFKDGYLHCDLRALPHVDIVCNAWEINTKINNVDKIYSRHMLEHLTNKEADLTLKSWYEILDTDGELELIVPNFDLRVQQWQKCEWEDYENPTEEEIWSVAGLWGWQRECDPLKDNYNQTHWDVHKSGYNPKRITMILKYIGFSDITTHIDDKNNLIVMAYKREVSERDI